MVEDHVEKEEESCVRGNASLFFCCFKKSGEKDSVPTPTANETLDSHEWSASGLSDYHISFQDEQKISIDGDSDEDHASWNEA